MSRSTTPDLIKMLGKLQDFFNQQQRSGMHAFTGHRPLASSSSLPLSRSSLRYGQKREMDEKREDMDSSLKQDGKDAFRMIANLHSYVFKVKFSCYFTSQSQSFNPLNVLYSQSFVELSCTKVLLTKVNSLRFHCRSHNNLIIVPRASYCWILFIV